MSSNEGLLKLAGGGGGRCCQEPGVVERLPPRQQVPTDLSKTPLSSHPAGASNRANLQDQ